MKRLTPWAICLFLLSAESWSQEATNDTYLGYAFPAGARAGETCDVLLGGRYLRNPKAVYFSGSGIEAEVVQFYPMIRNLNGTLRKILHFRMAERASELTGRPIPKKIQKSYDALSEAELKRQKVPRHPLFDRIGSMDEKELKQLRLYLAEYNKQQANDQIGERVQIRIKVSGQAEPGMREMRLLSPSGLSNPIRFQVGQFPEVLELEPNDGTATYSPDAEFHSAPTVINGQIKPGDVDRFLLRIDRDRTIHFDLLARRLIPYVADAVPGWFQATLAIYDIEGKRLAFVDDTYGDPDPSLNYTFENGGIYIIEIRDAIYRGCDNFIYRLYLSDDKATENFIQQPDIDYASPEIPFTKEREPNNTFGEAQPVSLPLVSSGAIRQAGERDFYRFIGEPDDRIIIQTEARCFDSPMDSLIRIFNQEGEMLALNDDYVEKREHLYMGPGLMTHYADSYLSYELPAAGIYYVSIEDAQRKSGPDYKYRLRISLPRPDFEARISPSTLNIRPTGCTDFKIYLNRIDGFESAVTLELVDPPEGARLHNARIPAGQNEVWASLEWPKSAPLSVENVQLQAIASLGQESIRRTVVPSDNSMQAFLWRHLLPAQECRVANLVGYRILGFGGDGPGKPLQLAAGKKVTFHLPLSFMPKEPEQFQFRLKEAPDGLELVQSKFGEKQIALTFRCPEPLKEVPSEGNLIVEVIRKTKNKRNNKTFTNVIGVLPAIRYEFNTP